MAGSRKPTRAPHLATYEVGYGKPPRDGQFQAGQSGNPAGRPKGSKNRPPETARLVDEILDEARRLVTVLDGGGEQKQMTTQRALIRSLASSAFKGNHHAQKSFLQLAAAAEHHTEREWRAFLEEAIAYKVDGTHRLQAQGVLGEAEPLIPDPRHMTIEDDRVIVRGPNTPDEKREYDRLQVELRRAQTNLERAERTLATASKETRREAHKSLRTRRAEVAALSAALAGIMTIIVRR